MRAQLQPVPRAFGACDVLLSKGGMTMSSVTLRPHLALAPHAHECGQLCVVLEGSYEESVGGRTVPLTAGSVLWRPAGGLHANRVGRSEVHALLVDLDPARTRRLWAHSRPAYFSPGVFSEIHREIAGELRTRDEHSQAALEALLLLLGARVGRHAGPSARNRPAWLARAVEFAAASYTQSISVADVARAAGVHPVTVASAFRRYLGRSVGQYILDLRVDHARRELLRSRDPIAAIAARAGFYDESHLGRVFRRRFGRPPGALRRDR